MAKRKKSKNSEKLEIKNHVLVPKHEKCPETEKKALLKKYNAEILLYSNYGEGTKFTIKFLNPSFENPYKNK